MKFEIFGGGGRLVFGILALVFCQFSSVEDFAANAQERCGDSCCESSRLSLEIIENLLESAEEPPIVFLYLSTDEHVTGQTLTFWNSSDLGHPNSHTGNKCDLDDREIEYNDEAKSALLHGPPGTSVTIYNAKNCAKGEGFVQLVVPAGATECRVTSFREEALPSCVVDRNRSDKLTGKVSGFKWG